MKGGGGGGGCNTITIIFLRYFNYRLYIYTSKGKLPSCIEAFQIFAQRSICFISGDQIPPELEAHPKYLESKVFRRYVTKQYDKYADAEKLM